MQTLLLPGVGADRRLFEAVRGLIPDVVVPPWLEPRREEGLAEYAARWAAAGSWPSPLVIGGASFGGMVALELARHLRPTTVVLIGSCAHPSELAPHLRVLRRFAGRLHVPQLPTTGPAAALLAVYFGANSAETRRVFLDMLRDTDTRFLAWALPAIAGWRPEPLTGVRLLRVHGRRDHLIPCPERADVKVDGAGHLLALTHAEAVASVLAALVREERSPDGA